MTNQVIPAEAVEAAVRGLSNLPVVVSPALPIAPTDAENIVRMVRHGLADVLARLGEDVGPKPDDCTHAIMGAGTLFVSQEMRDKLAGYDAR